MMNTTLDVSVIICAYTEERWSDMTAAVESIWRQTIPPREIILVIDHNERLLERVKADMPGVVAIANAEPRGLSGARNSGIAVAQGAFIAYLDDDAAAEPDWLERLLHCCEDTNVLGAGGMVEPAWVEKRPAWFPREFLWVVGCSYLPLPAHPVEVRNPFGGCTCYRREVFEAVGGFTNGIGRAGKRPMGCEETELCIRARQRWPDKVFLYDPRAVIHHRVPPARATWHYFRARCYAEGLSKAAVTEQVGAKDGLSSERSYTLHTLPRGALRGLADGITRRDGTGFARAGAIIAGLLITTAGYIVGTVSRRLRGEIAPMAHTRDQPASVHYQDRPLSSIDSQTLNSEYKDEQKSHESLYTSR